MWVDVDDYYQTHLSLLCMFKVLHDAGITYFDDDGVFNDIDYYYEFVMEALGEAAPIVVANDQMLYRKYGYDEENAEVFINAYSCEEMQEYYKIARKLYRLEGHKEKENPYEKAIEKEIEKIRGFHSYSFDYFIGNKRKCSQLEILWGYEFTCEIALILWVVRVMKLFKDELPKLKEKYRAAKRRKRSGLAIKGGSCYAA